MKDHLTKDKKDEDLGKIFIPKLKYLLLSRCNSLRFTKVSQKVKDKYLISYLDNNQARWPRKGSGAVVVTPCNLQDFCVSFLPGR